MNNIWSENKKVNTAVNILLLLMATNFFNYGQLLLPIICLILFIDNKYKFNVNNIRTFIVLCLFGITFLAFSYELGLYSFIGLFLPMAYYIGSNIKEVNEENIKHIIYLLTLGMGTHVLLNFGTDLFQRGPQCFKRNSHLDVWTQGEYPTTQTSILYIFIIGIVYYVLIYENNKKFRKILLSFFVLMMIYEIALGRRSPFLILAVVAYTAMLADMLIMKNRNKLMLMVIYATLVCIIFALFLIYFSIHGNLEVRMLIERISIFRKFTWFGFESGRLNIFAQAMKLAPYHMFGGKEISAIIEWDIHDLWFDTFDYAGIVPFIILVLHSVISTFVFVKFYKNMNISKEFKFLISTLFGCIIFQMCIEPIMTGASIFLLCSVVVFALLERLTIIVYNK